MELRNRMAASPKRRVVEGDIDSEEEVGLPPCPGESDLGGYLCSSDSLPSLPQAGNLHLLHVTFSPFLFAFRV